MTDCFGVELAQRFADVARLDRQLDAFQASVGRASVGGYLTAELSQRLQETEVEYRAAVKMLLFSYADSVEPVPYVRQAEGSR